jgi:hypothetical protein
VILKVTIIQEGARGKEKRKRPTVIYIANCFRKIQDEQGTNNLL